MSVTERMWKTGEVVKNSHSWLPPLLMSASVTAWLIFIVLKYRLTPFEGRVLASIFIALYLIGALIELRILLLARLSWNLIKEGGSVGLKDVLVSAISIALYPVVLGALLSLRIVADRRVRAKDSILTVVTLGFWLSVIQTRILSNLSDILLMYQAPELISSRGEEGKKDPWNFSMKNMMKK